MAMAQRMAEQGQRTLLVELGDHSYFELAFGFRSSYDPLPIAPNLFHSLWSGETCLREYIRHLIPVRPIADLFFDNRIMRTFVRAAPGLKELAILGKLTSGVRNWGPPLPFDNLVLDGYATGHLLALLRAPKGMAELVERGPMGTESRRISEVMCSPQVTQFTVVSLPEELPVSESLELMHDLKVITGQTPKLICNRVYEFSEELRVSVNESPLKKDELSFPHFLGLIMEQQDLAIGKLSAIEKVPKLPFVLSSDPKIIVDQLRNKVEIAWV